MKKRRQNKEHNELKSTRLINSVCFFSKSGVNIALGVQFEEMGFPRWMFWVAVSFILVRALVDIILTLLARLFNSDAEG